MEDVGGRMEGADVYAGMAIWTKAKRENKTCKYQRGITRKDAKDKRVE